MYSIILLFLALFCQNGNAHHACTVPNCTHSTQVTTMDDDPGDTGHVPPKPPVPPPPPGNNP